MCSGLIPCLICYAMHLRLSILAWLGAPVDQVKLFLFSFFFSFRLFIFYMLCTFLFVSSFLLCQIWYLFSKLFMEMTGHMSSTGSRRMPGNVG